MAFKDVLPALRRERGVTQKELAARVYVTRQAVSRWETGRTEPGVDMRRHVAAALGVPPAVLFDMPDEPVCQSCGTPFSVPNMPRGTNADGSESADYCAWCYRDGEFAAPDLDALIEQNAPYFSQAYGTSVEEAALVLGAVLPGLKRWAGASGE